MGSEMCIRDRIDGDGDRVHLALRIQLSYVLIQLPFGDNRQLSDVERTCTAVLPLSLNNSYLLAEFKYSWGGAKVTNLLCRMGG